MNSYLTVLIPFIIPLLFKLAKIIFSISRETIQDKIMLERFNGIILYDRIVSIKELTQISISCIVIAKISSLALIYLFDKYVNGILHYTNVVLFIGIVLVYCICSYQATKEKWWGLIVGTAYIYYVVFLYEAFSLDINLKILSKITKINIDSFERFSPVNDQAMLICYILMLSYIIVMIIYICDIKKYVKLHNRISNNTYMTIYFDRGMLKNYPLNEFIKCKEDIDLVHEGKIYSIPLRSIEIKDYDYMESKSEYELVLYE